MTKTMIKKSLRAYISLCRQKFIFYTDFSIFPESACPFARKFDCQ